MKLKQFNIAYFPAYFREFYSSDIFILISTFIFFGHFDCGRGGGGLVSNSLDIKISCSSKERLSVVHLWLMMLQLHRLE